MASVTLYKQYICQFSQTEKANLTAKFLKMGAGYHDTELFNTQLLGHLVTLLSSIGFWNLHVHEKRWTIKSANGV